MQLFEVNPIFLEKMTFKHLRKIIITKLIFDARFSMHFVDLVSIKNVAHYQVISVVEKKTVLNYDFR